MAIKYKVIDASDADNTLVVEYAEGARKITVNIGYPEDDSDLVGYITDRVPDSLTRPAKVAMKTVESVKALRGTIKPKQSSTNPVPNGFSLKKM